VTPTCAANALGLVPEDSPARGDERRIALAMNQVAEALGGVSNQEAAEKILDRSFPKVANVVEDLIDDYGLDRNLLTLSGGGGGAWAIVPYTAKKMGLPHEIAPNAPMISAIGAALALVRDTIERTVVAPTEHDILDIRREAEEAVVRMGADPSTVEVQVEIDPQKNILRAMASGATEFRSRDLSKRLLTDEEIEAQVRKSIRETLVELRRLGEIGGLVVFEAQTEREKFFGMRREMYSQVRVIDREGVIRLQIARGDGFVASRAQAAGQLRPFVLERTVYGDAGKALPDVFVVYRGRILDLSGLQSFDQITTLMNVELDRLPGNEQVAALVKYSGHAA